MNAVLLGVAVGLTVACSGTPPSPASTASAAPDPARVGTIRGRIALGGDPPTMAVTRLDGDPKCVSLAAGEERRSEEVVVGDDDGLQHVFVYVKDRLPARLYVSEGDGTYVLANIPPGTYTIEAWHERLGTQAQQVHITGGDSHDVAFTFAVQ